MAQASFEPWTSRSRIVRPDLVILITTRDFDDNLRRTATICHQDHVSCPIIPRTLWETMSDDFDHDNVYYGGRAFNYSP